MRRLAALIASVALIGGAYVVRSGMDRDEVDSSRRLNVVCVKEIEAACESIAGVKIEQAGETADRLVIARDQADAAIDAWIAPAPWVSAVDAVREQAGRPRLFRSTVSKGAARIVAVTFGSANPCGGSTTWACIAGLAARGEPIGAPAADSATGLLVRAAGLTAVLGREDFDVTNDVLGSVAAQDFLSSFERSVERATTGQAGSVQQFLALQGAPAKLYVTTSADADAAFAPTFRAVDLGPGAYELVVAAPDEVRSAHVADLVDIQGHPPKRVAEPDGLPSPGVLFALREVL